MLFVIDALLFALALIFGAVLLRAARAEKSAAEAQARADLLETGLSLEGDPLGSYALRGDVDGATVELVNHVTMKRPGRSADEDQTVPSCVLRVAVPLADLIVCKAQDADEVMGPLPTAPRIRTGHPTFDARYAVFVSPRDDAMTADYRTTGTATAAAWAQAPILERLAEFELRWLRVQDGRAEIVLPPLDISDVGRVAALASAFSRAAERASYTAPVGGPRREPTKFSDPAGRVVGVALLAAVSAVSIGWGIAFIPALWRLNDALLCGPEGHIVETSCSADGVCLGCDRDPQRYLTLHYIGAMGLTAAVVLLVGFSFIAFYAERTRAGRSTRARGGVSG